jgi:hypothetical protein
MFYLDNNKNRTLHILQLPVESGERESIPTKQTCTVARREVKFPYIHMMPPEHNGPRRENISRMRAGKIYALLRQFLTLPEFSSDILHEKKVSSGWD